jgi:N-carbamoyl-L-amino-acid hydrolase
MSERVIELMKGEADATGIPYEIMPSGAGHDSAVFANAGVPSAMVFVRNDKGSHNPQEAMEYEDFFQGSEVLSRAIWQAANHDEEFRT